MAHSLSAKKRDRQNASLRERNRSARSAMRTQVKKFSDAAIHGEVETATGELQASYKTLDQMAAKGIIHRRTADRKKGRLARQLNKISSSKSKG